MAVGRALPVEARDGLLADVAALREGHRALVQPRLLGHRVLAELDAEAGTARSTRSVSAVRLVDRHGPAPARRPRAGRRSPRSRRAGRGPPRCGSLARRRRPLRSRDARARRVRGPAPARRRQPARAARGGRAGACACAARRGSRCGTVCRASKSACRATRSVSSSSSSSVASTRTAASMRPLCVSSVASAPRPAPRSRHVVGERESRNSAACGAAERELAALGAVDHGDALAWRRGIRAVAVAVLTRRAYKRCSG